MKTVLRGARLRLFLAFIACIGFLPTNLLSGQLSSQEAIDSKLLSGMQWRLIGPFRGGRVTAVAGAADPNTYYFGTPGGGVWKTTDGGRVWHPVFDNERVASIGAVAVAPSDSNVLYVGTGEQTRGNGVYRSTDAGSTWKNVGLQDVPFIQAIIVDPKDPDVAVVGGNSIGFGILWRPMPATAKTANRGIFRTVDGGKNWTKVFSAEDSIGVVDLCSDPDNPATLYAALYRPGSGSGDSAIEATSDIVKSADGGSTWAALASTGLPEKARGRVGVAVAAGTGGRRMYAIMEQGFFRSDDGGATWHQSTKDPRVTGNDYFSRVFIDTRNPDVLYVSQTSMYRSTDGGKTFEAFAGAPSGDDFHVAWIDPREPARMIFGVDQGAIVTVDGGKTWSSWYNQPTGQFYHVSTDNLFPYRVYGAQQDSGTAGVLSRSDYGEILLQDWFSMGGFEYAFIAPDPAHPNFVYSEGWYRSVVRYDKSTGEIATVFERGKKYRASSMPPLAFSPQDPSTLFLGMQFVLKTVDGGKSWREISPDLTGYGEQEEPEKPDPDKPRPPAITALSLSSVQSGVIWVGTTNRVVQLTRNGGKNWQDVSPSGLSEPAEILYVEASHHDPGAAYLTVGGVRESTPPYVARTDDYGKTWQKIINGFPENEMVRVVREDPKRTGLLYAGTDTGIYVSWDRGDHWQPLSLNLPPTPITDLQVHDNDLVISTFGRSLWILDDITPLREISPQIIAADAHLFAPETALRVRWDNYQDTPYPIETPAGHNPPDGAILDYYLKTPPAGELTLTIYDGKGAEVARFSSDAKSPTYLPANAPSYWFAPEVSLPKAAGVNRFVWNLRYPPPPSLPYGYYGNLLEYSEYTLADHAVPGLTPRVQPRGPLVLPGTYTIELRVGSQSLRQRLTVELDPRVQASPADLSEQLDLAKRIAQGMKASSDAFYKVAEFRKTLTERTVKLKQSGDKKTKEAVAEFEKKIDAVDNGSRRAPGFGPVNRDLSRLIFSVESADMRPADTVQSAAQQRCEELAKDLANWRQLTEQDLSAFNAILAANQQAPLPTVAAIGSSGCKP
ncbi:MAG TPA: hypothetical protein VMD99_12255 [Terriglobales bacterium]|nr:hypothetical protein [Terriglobales bacterium]